MYAEPGMKKHPIMRRKSRKQRIKSLCDNRLNLLEGRQYYDCFVLGAKSMGVYAEVNTGSGGGVVLAAPAVTAAGAVTVAEGATAFYTTDGTDPRYSLTAKAGSSITAAKGAVMKVYQTAEGKYPSPVTTAVHS